MRGVLVGFSVRCYVYFNSVVVALFFGCWLILGFWYFACLIVQFVK